jgi:cytidyltransferase-like protein
MKKIAISGYFDPIHIGHLEYIKMAKSLGDYLIVIVNNDKQAVLKKGKSFMCEDDRLEIVSQIKGVDEAVMSIDDDKTVCKTLDLIKPDVFANGGDRSNGEIPEYKICKENETQVIDGLGDKIRSSSDLTGIK